MDLFAEGAIRTMMEIEERAKDLKQRFLQMRRHGIQKFNQYADHHPRGKVAAEASVQASASIINDECPGQTDHKLKLCFNGSLKSTIYTNKPLLGQTNEGIEIAICADDQIITSGRLASLRVEIVALERDHSCKGEWTEEDFDRQIRKTKDGLGSVLDGECLVKLVNGKASLGNIRFKEGSTGTHSREFVLAARVCRSENIGGPRVEEAFMHPPFSVLVGRSKGNEKSSLPKLDDKIYDLKGIARNGPYARRLEKENIHTVQDFLKALNRDQLKLHRILEIKSLPSWEAMLRHARKCDLRDRRELRSYKVETSNVFLFFNCIDDLVGAKFHGLYVAKNKFNAAQKILVDTQLQQAYNELDAIPFDYVMGSKHPVKISANINADYEMESSQDVKISTNTDAAGSTSIPALLDASPQNAPGYRATFQAENSSPYDHGIDRLPDLPPGDTNQNAVGQGSSELSHPVHFNGHTNKGQSDIPYHNTMPGCPFGGTFAYVVGTSTLCPQALGMSSDLVMEEDSCPVDIPTDVTAVRSTSISTLLSASLQNASGNQATFQATGNTRPLFSGTDCVPGLPFRDANCNAAGQSASELCRPDQCNGPVNQGLGQNCIHDPEGGMISPHSNANVGHAENYEEIWKLLDCDLQTQTNTNPDCSPGGTFPAQNMMIFCQQDNVFEETNDVWWPKRVADA